MAPNVLKPCDNPESEADSEVTINEEFVANEQMNNLSASEHHGASSPSAPVASPPAAAAAAMADSGASSDEDVADEDNVASSPTTSPAPQGPQAVQSKPKKAQDNHQSGKNQRTKQKRIQSTDSQKSGKTPVKPESSPASSPQQPQAPPAPQATPVNHSHSNASGASSVATNAIAAATGVANAAATTAASAVAAVASASTNGPRPKAAGPAGTGTAAFPHMEAVNRVLALPVVESGVSIVSGVYSRVKNVNPVLQWSLGTAEGAVRSSLGRSLSLLGPFSGPLSVVDALLCRGLDMVEYNVPAITLPPELLMTAGRDYMSMRVVAPVLRMTATNARLADTLAARALDSAEVYVDKYLPGDAATENGDAGYAGANVKGGAALQRADRLSRKLQRRITRRTLLEARALRKDTENTLHTLVFFAETLVKDPRAFVEQCRAVWSHLSENEPENQVPPETLEERLALLVREVARRVVHLANFTAANANGQRVSTVANQVLKSVRVEGERVMSYAQSQLEKVQMKQVLGDVNNYTHLLLERLAHLLAGLRSSSHSLARRFPHAGTNNIGVVN